VIWLLASNHRRLAPLFIFIYSWLHSSLHRWLRSSLQCRLQSLLES
jgi:hypothetical protein